MKITKLLGFQVLDSRGRPTVAASITLDDGTTHTARVPSGASTGKHEALELRDGEQLSKKSFYGSLAVSKAVDNVNLRIAPPIVGCHVDLNSIDAAIREIDTTPNFSSLGANATLAVSLAAAKASAHAQNKSLARYFQPQGNLLIPMPMVNILSGGAHANRSLDFQDVLVIPNGARTFTEALSWIVAIRETAARLGSQAGNTTHLVADEGGLGIAFDSIEPAMDFLIEAIEKVGLEIGSEVSLALDVASTQFFSNGTYSLASSQKSYSSADFVSYIHKLVSNYAIVSIEDPFAEDDWEGWSSFMEIAPKALQVLGDDLLTTNSERLNKAIKLSSANSILIKPNQNGLVTDTHTVLKAAQGAGFATVVSARSGETEDSWLADLATGWRAGQIKVGSTHGSERNAKWNRLLELEQIENVEFSRPFL
jgi:enolase